jgi:mRNA interferase HigB
MNVVAKKTLEAFWTIHPAAKAPLTAWYAVASKTTWATPQDIKAQFNSADFVSDNRVIFNIGGNNYRLVARVSYTFKAVLVKFVGTHKEYDNIDPNTV